MSTNNIEIRGLVKQYGEFSLGPIDLDIPKGCIVGYIGENGSGKSTTIKAILDIIKADSGEIKIFGEDSKNLSSELKENIGVVMDKNHLPEELTLTQIQAFCSMLYKNWDQKLFDELKAKLDIPSNRKVKELSKGTAMKLSIIIALAHHPKLLILDEPTSGLDPVVRSEIIDMLLDFIQDEEHSVFISSHIISDLERATDYIAFLHRGKLVFVKSMDELREEYAICRVDKEKLYEIDERAIIGRRSNQFSEELLVYRKLMPSHFELERVNLEDIMLYTVKGGKS